MKSRGQMKMSFNMIFSIILIVVFLAFAIFAITKFIGMQRATQILNFKSDLQEDVDNLWKGSKGSQEESYILPEAIEELCFVDFDSGIDEQKYKDLKIVFSGYENVVFYPISSAKGNAATKINNIDIKKMTSTKNPYCIQVKKGKVSLSLSKNYGDALVLIS